MGYSELSDGELVLLTRSGQDDAFQTLVDRRQGFVFALARRFLRNSADADEATQDTWIDFYYSGVLRGNYDILEPLKPYLARITANRCSKIIKRTQRHIDVLRNVLWGVKASAALAGPDSLTLGDLEDEVERLRKCISDLPRSMQDVINLYIDGLGDDEIAVTLAIEPGAIRVRRYRAIRKLRACLRRLEA